MKPSERSALKVVLDTQVLLRGAVARTESLTARIYDAWREGRFALLLSDAILAEIEAVLGRPEVAATLPTTSSSSALWRELRTTSSALTRIC